MIYLASPYTHAKPEVREDRYHAVCHAAAYFMSQGKHIFSPIAHTHGICLQSGGTNFAYDFWKQFDEEMIRLCEEFWILQMEGWNESAGIKAEMAYAMSIGRRIQYV